MLARVYLFFLDVFKHEATDLYCCSSRRVKLNDGFTLHLFSFSFRQRLRIPTRWCHSCMQINPTGVVQQVWDSGEVVPTLVTTARSVTTPWITSGLVFFFLSPPLPLVVVRERRKEALPTAYLLSLRVPWTTVNKNPNSQDTHTSSYWLIRLLFYITPLNTLREMLCPCYFTQLFVLEWS